MKSIVKKGLAYRRIAEEMFIVDSQRAELHELNGPAALIWAGLAAGKDEAGIVSDITAEFEVTQKEAAADFKDLVEKLAAAGLLEKPEKDRP